LLAAECWVVATEPAGPRFPRRLQSKGRCVSPPSRSRTGLASPRRPVRTSNEGLFLHRRSGTTQIGAEIVSDACCSSHLRCARIPRCGQEAAVASPTKWKRPSLSSRSGCGPRAGGSFACNGLGSHLDSPRAKRVRKDGRFASVCSQTRLGGLKFPPRSPGPLTFDPGHRERNFSTSCANPCGESVCSVIDRVHGDLGYVEVLSSEVG
jgi:hypothetical protein